MENERISLPVVALRGMTILPEMVAHFDVSREKSLQAIDQAMTEGEKIFLTGQYEIETEDPDVTDIHRIGCIATIKQIVKLPKKISRVLISGEQRAELIDLEFKEPYLRGMVAVREDVDTSWEDTGAEQSPLNLEAMVQGLRDIFKEYMAKNPKMMLCDEPTGALDYQTGKAILKLLQDMCREKNMTVIVITHNTAITPMADRVIRIKNGQVSDMNLNPQPTPVEQIEW